MKLATIKTNQGEEAAVRIGDTFVAVQRLNDAWHTNFPHRLYELINESGAERSLAALGTRLALADNADLSAITAAGTPFSDCRFGPLYRHPRKIWGIGLNYREHASDLREKSPTEEPASFMKADTTIIGPGDTILLPRQSKRVTAEAEIAVVMGRICHNVTVEEAPDYVAGFTTVIDMTAEDILEQNPRFLTRAKNFDTFFSFGPELLTPDEIPDLNGTKVGTYRNGALHRENVVANMTFLPWFLVAFHSQVMTLLPGDIISTGTPGAVVIRDGDVAECQIDGFLPLVNPVRNQDGGEERDD